jgi:hypothetical protein
MGVRLTLAVGLAEAVPVLALVLDGIGTVAVVAGASVVEFTEAGTEPTPLLPLLSVAEESAELMEAAYAAGEEEKKAAEGE